MITIDIRGIPEITKKLENLSGKHLKEAYWEMVRATQDTIEKKAKEICPAHTGALRNSIIIIPQGFRYKESTVIVRAGGTYAPHAEAQEYGFTLTWEGLKAMARKKGGITPKGYLPYFVGGTRGKRWIPGKFFMAQAKNYGVPLIIERLDKKINELTKR